VIFATILDTTPQSLMVQPDIRVPQDLKGKKLGITRFGSLSDFRRRVTATLALEHPLHGKEREPILANRLPQLLERCAVVRQLPQQLEACLASLATGSLQQSLALEVDRHVR